MTARICFKVCISMAIGLLITACASSPAYVPDIKIDGQLISTTIDYRRSYGADSIEDTQTIRKLRYDKEYSYYAEQLMSVFTPWFSGASGQAKYRIDIVAIRFEHNYELNNYDTDVDNTYSSLWKINLTLTNDETGEVVGLSDYTVPINAVGIVARDRKYNNFLWEVRVYASLIGQLLVSELTTQDQEVEKYKKLIDQRVGIVYQDKTGDFIVGTSESVAYFIADFASSVGELANNKAVQSAITNGSKELSQYSKNLNKENQQFVVSLNRTIAMEQNRVDSQNKSMMEIYKQRKQKESMSLNKSNQSSGIQRTIKDCTSLGGVYDEGSSLCFKQKKDTFGTVYTAQYSDLKATKLNENTIMEKSEKEKSKCLPIDENGVAIPTSGMPTNRLCYKYTLIRPIQWGDNDIESYPQGRFGYESSTSELAINNVELALKKKARDICKSEGYDGIYSSEYIFGDLINWSYENCASRIKLGTKLYTCLGSASYRCGVPQ